MKKKIKNGVRRLMCAALSLALLCGCGKTKDSEILLEIDPEAEDDSKKVIITYYSAKADTLNLVAIEKALRSFMDMNPDVYVAYEGVKGTAYWNTFDLRSKTGNLDDIVMINHDRTLTLSGEGKLADLSGLPTLDNYIPWVREQFTNKDGAVYFLPTCISTYGLYINTDLLEKHGQKIPENLAEFTGVCDYFVSQGITPVVVNNFYSLPTVMMAKSMTDIYSTSDPRAEIEKFNSGEKNLAEQFRSGIDFVSLMLDRGWIDGEEAANTAQTSDDLDIFSEGTRPFMITGGWASVRLNVDFSYGVYPYPVLDGGCVMTVNADTCIAVNANSKHVKEAMDLVEYLTEPEVMWEYCDSQSSYSPLKDKRVPSDEAAAPCAPYLSNGPIVLRSDYNLELPLDSALIEVSQRMLLGLDANGAEKLLEEMLYSDNAGGDAS